MGIIDSSQLILGVSSVLFIYWWKKQQNNRRQELNELRNVIEQLREEVEQVRVIIQQRRAIQSLLRDQRLRTGYALVQRVSLPPPVAK